MRLGRSLFPRRVNELTKRISVRQSRRASRLAAAVSAPGIAMASTKPSAEPEKAADLPKLTPTEFRQYNKMAEMMDRYHNHFRDACTLCPIRLIPALVRS